MNLLIMYSIYLISINVILSYANEDVYEINGAINADAKPGDPVELESPLNSPYFEMVANIKSFDAKAEICGYTIYGGSVENSPPFEIDVSNHETGEGQILVAKNKKIDPDRASYTFEVAPHICKSGRHLQRSLVNIEVEPGREMMRSEHPTFIKSAFKVEVTEGRFYDPLLHLDAQPGSTKAAICHYHVVDTSGGGDIPFAVDNTGYLRNTEQLDAIRRSKYIFKVTAEDCQHRVSEPATIEIIVKSSCVSGWIGIPDRIEFEAGQGSKIIAESATLELCDQLCNVTRITTSVRLATSHIGKGCDRDTYSLKSLRKLCGGKGDIVDLLPPTLPHLQLSKLQIDDGKESDEIFSFDGKESSVEIMDDLILRNKFTFATWMKHDRQIDGHKEQIICTSDSDGMNRHHFSISLRHCHLIMLLRREPGNDWSENSDTYYPSEWKWSLPEICDSNWHHYALTVDSLQANLYIDGRKFEIHENNPEISSDFPLHKSKHVHSIKTVIGACWQGGKQKMSQYLKGYLAGVSILGNDTEKEEVLTCLNNCQERLTFNAVDEMETGMTVSMNTDMTQISITGSEASAVMRLVRKIGYTNERSYPTPGHRPITFDTKILCDKKDDISIEPIKSLIMVSEFLKPKLNLLMDGNKISLVEQDKLTKGVNFLLGIQITSMAKSYGKANVDMCEINVEPPLLANLEHFRFSDNLAKQMDIEVLTSQNLLHITGVDTSTNYEKFLSEIAFVAKRSQKLSNKKFIVSCSDMNGRFTSNQLEIQLNVVHDLPPVTMLVPDLLKVDKHVHEEAPHKSKTFDGPHISKKQQITPSSSATGVVVVCFVGLGFIVLLAAIGLSRVRGTGSHDNRSEVALDVGRQELEWDNSALTITVNPMEQDMASYEEQMKMSDSEDDNEDDVSDDGIAIDDVIIDQPTNQNASCKSELEWDDSTIIF